MSATFFDTLRDRKRSGFVALALILLSASLFLLLLITQPPILTRFLGIIYLGSATLIGAWLYFTNPTFYLGFTWWIWFASPFVRRYIDFTLGGFTPPDQAFALLAPLAVSSLTGIGLFRYGKLLIRRPHLPLFLCVLGLVYGLCVGAIYVGPFGAVIQFAEWLVPVLMAFHLTTHAHRYPAYRSTLQRVFVGAVFVLGAYGVAQYFYPAPWDRMWMVGSEMTTIGKPEPMEVRVFGMLDSPGPYAIAMMVGLLVAISSRASFSKIAILPGLGGFLLSMVRSAWGGFALGLIAALTRLSGGNRIRTIAVILVVGVATVPLLGDSEIGAVAGDRMATFQDLQTDQSFQDRTSLYQDILLKGLSQPLGNGLGSAHWDSGYITIIWQLGWIGGGLYLTGYFLFVRSLFRIERADLFTSIAFGIGMAFVALMFMGSQHGGFNGFLQWTFLAMVVLSNRYYAAVLPPAEPSPSSPEEARAESDIVAA